ncbi:MAG: hypothetical protein ABIS17_14310 [Casimicrobiaceae bacterium]
MASIEDALAEEDWDGWRPLTARLGARVRLGATTSSAHIARGSNAALPAGSATA